MNRKTPYLKFQLQSEIVKLKHQISVLKEALEWYADPDCYRFKVVPDCSEAGCCSRFENSSIQDDEGEVAGRALKELERLNSLLE